ncbi:MAG: hypothetical protein C0483_13305 [Pirellula sp.]|nr:hypothetical protein [Pirellula sp.]
MVRVTGRPKLTGWKRAAISVALVLSQADFSISHAQQAALNAPPPSTAPSGDLPEGPGATIVGALEDGVGSQGSVVSGNTVLSSPNLTPTPLNQTASSITVITAEQIQQRGQVNVAEVLRGVPGLDVVRNSTPGSPTSVFLRGAPNEHTKVLIDGIPANDPLSVGRGFDFSNLSVDNIEKIEIIRGPQSVLYGTDAIGGVILITTRKGEGPNAGRVSAWGGSFSTANTAANTSGSQGPFYYSAGGSYFDSNGFSAADRRLPGNVEDDGFQLGTFSTRAGWQPNQNVSVDFVLRYNQGIVDTDNGRGAFGDGLNNSDTIQQTVAGVRIHTKNEEGWYEQTLSYYVSDVVRGSRFPGFFFFSHYAGNTQQVDWRNTFHLLDTDWFGTSTTVGTWYQTEVGSALEGTDAVPRSSLDDAAIYGEQQVRIGESWYTTAGVRSDNYNAYGANDTYRFTSLYRVPGLNTGIRGTIGTGFRAPSLYQRFSQYGNPAILPETSKGWDFGVEQPMFDGNLVPSVTYFRNDFRNLIDFDFNAGPIGPFGFPLGQYYNAFQARTTGIEFATLFVLDDRTTLTTSYTYMETHAPSIVAPPPIGTDAPLLRRPTNKLGVQFNRRILNNRAAWNVGVIYVGTRDDADTNFPSTRVKLPAYTVVNTAITYDLTRQIQLTGRIDNVFNERYQEVFGYGTAPVSGYAGAAVRW